MVAVDVEPPNHVNLASITKVTGWGPPDDLVQLSEWAAWRWAGKRVAFLRSASPGKAVRALPKPRASQPRVVSQVVATPANDWSAVSDVIDQAFEGPLSVLRLPPNADRFPVALKAASMGNSLLLVPSAHDERRLSGRLIRSGINVARMPDEWAVARAGATVVGTRATAWAPVCNLASVVVFDEHDEALHQEQTPTWHARDVAIERAERAGVPVVLVSPTPTLEALERGPLCVPPRGIERSGWPIVEVVDRRDDDPAKAGLLSSELARVLQSGASVVCVINRKGRSRLLACAGCGEVARCESCGTAVVMTNPDELECRACSTVRPVVCSLCGRSKMKNLRAGVSRIREELEALARQRVIEVTAEVSEVDVSEARIHVGTEAVLHRIHRADLVAFLDFDQELLAPRYRAAEEALALLVRAARIVGPRRDSSSRSARAGSRRDNVDGEGVGRILVQTRIPDHEVVQAALHADPDRVARAERARRTLLRYPPISNLALVSGVAAPAFMDRFGSPEGVEVMGPSDGRWLVRADQQEVLLDALRRTPRPVGRLRIEVDPLRI